MTVEVSKKIGGSNIFELGPRDIDKVPRIIVAGGGNMTLEEAQSLASATSAIIFDIFDGEAHTDLQPSPPAQPKV